METIFGNNELITDTVSIPPKIPVDPTTSVGDHEPIVSLDEDGCLTPFLELFYGDMKSIPLNYLLNLFERSWKYRWMLSKIMLYTRSIVSGKGTRRGLQEYAYWLKRRIISGCITGEDTSCEKIILEGILAYMPIIGSFADWSKLFGTECEPEALLRFGGGIRILMSEESPSLIETTLAKWVPRENKSKDKKFRVVGKLCSFLECSRKQYRSVISKATESLSLVETRLSKKQPATRITKLGAKKYKKVISSKEGTVVCVQEEISEQKLLEYPHKIPESVLRSPDIDFEKIWNLFCDTITPSRKTVCVSGFNEGFQKKIADVFSVMCADMYDGCFRDCFISHSILPTIKKTTQQGIINRLVFLDSVEKRQFINVTRLLKHIVQYCTENKEPLPDTIVVLSRITPNIHGEILALGRLSERIPDIVFWEPEPHPVVIQKINGFSRIIKGFHPGLYAELLEDHATPESFMFRVINERPFRDFPVLPSY